MEPYAVVETGGKQYRVKANDTLRVEHLDKDIGEKIDIPRVLAVSTGEELRVGKPEIEDATVTAEVIDHIRGKKVVSFKQKRRKGYSRKIGHRQELTVIKVESIT